MTDSKNTRKTPEELRAETEALVAEAEKDNQEEVEDTESSVEEEEINDNNEEEQAGEVEEPTEDEEESAEEEEQEQEQAKPSPDYKKKFSESSREAQKVVAKNRKLVQAIDEAGEVEEPTEDELKVEYPDWELLDDTTKKVAKDNLTNTRRFALISQARVEAKKIEKWDEDVVKFLDDPQSFIDYPDIESLKDDFRLFANKETHHNVPFDVLAKSFLYEQSKTAKPKSKGSMFPTGSGGPNDKGAKKDGKISVAESEVLRKTNYEKYKRYLKEGKVDNSNF